MKLAEALIQRKDIQMHISQLKTRLLANAKHQEGVAPAEDPILLLEELSTATHELAILISKINKPNEHTTFDGRSISEILIERDVKAKEIAIVQDFLEAASDLTERMSRDEIVKLSSVNVSELRKKLDAKAKVVRALDLKIQELNWTTELV